MAGPKVSETKARQGRKGTPVLIVLVVAIVLAMAAWWIAEIYGVAIAPEQPVADAEHTID